MKKLLHKYNKYFTESAQKSLNKNFFETSNFYNLPKTHKSKVREAAVYSQNTEAVKVQNLSNLGQIGQQEDFVIFGYFSKAISKTC